MPMPGTNLTRDQLLAKLVPDQPGTTVSGTRGEAIYKQACATCHVFGDVGAPVGPDLTTVPSRFDRREVLEAILWPSRVISDQYVSTVLELTDGTTVSGVVVREDARGVHLQNADNPGRPLPVALDRIEKRTASTMSAMPEQLLAPYSLDDIDSLLSFLLKRR